MASDNWTITDALKSRYFWAPVLTIISVVGAIWALFYYVPLHIIGWTLFGIVGFTIVFVVGLVYYSAHVDNIYGRKH